MMLKPEDAIVKSIWDLCKHDEEAKSLTSYYSQLQCNNRSTNISDRRHMVTNSNSRMCV